MSNQRPNILWLTYEDTSPQFVSCYGHTNVVTTPAIDELAKDGVLFTNAFATAPVCSASRSALITGMCNEMTGLGHHRSKYPIPRETIRGFPWYLKKAGYYAANNAKTDYNIENERDFIRKTWNESSTSAHWRNRPADTPFFSVFNYNDSHQSRTMTKPWGWYEQHVLGELPDDEIISPDDINVPPIYRDNEEMRRYVSRVHNSLKLCDRSIKRRLDELENDGLMEDTIIFCFSDHGEGIPRGKCNGIGFGYRASFVIRFPEKYRHLSPWGAGSITDELISFEDLAPTVLSIAGCDIPEVMTGRALIGHKREEPRQYIYAARNRLDDTPDLCRSVIDDRFVYTRNYHPHLPVVKLQKYSDVGDILREIRKDYAEGSLNETQAELVKPGRPVEYLFDLKNDPWEIHNLAGDPEYAADLERMRTEALDHSRAISDVMFLPEKDMVSRAANSSPYEMRTDSSYNPLDQILEAASMVGKPEASGRQLELLESPIDVVRYWSAVGLYASGADHADAFARHLDDEYDLVRIEAAAGILKSSSTSQKGPAQAAVAALAQEIESTDPLTAHHAVEKLIYLPDAAPAFIEYVRAAQRKLSEAGDAGNQSAAFPLEQALDIFRYLYDGEALIYEEDKVFDDPESRKLDWSTKALGG